VKRRCSCVLSILYFFAERGGPRVKLKAGDKALIAVVLGAAGVILVVGLLWRRDVSRLEEELRSAKETAEARPAASSGDAPASPALDADLREEEREPAPVTEPPPEEPEYAPPPTKDPALAVFVDRRAATRDRVPRDITSRLWRLPHEEDVRAVVSVLRDTADSQTVRNEAANLLRRAGYAGLADELLDILRDPKETPRFRGFCVQHLWQSAKDAPPEEAERIGEEIRALLGDPDLPVRREALLACVEVPFAGGAGPNGPPERLHAPNASARRPYSPRCTPAASTRPSRGRDGMGAVGSGAGGRDR
jgi:hypothetical protein